LPTEIIGRWFYLYLILDIYSRKIVGWEAHETDDADHAARVVQRAALAEGIAANQTKPVPHGDNGATLKATTVPAMLHWLGIKPSYSRPRVSNDNAFAESAFRTAKYRPEYVRRGFKDLEIQSRMSQHGFGRNHPNAATSHGCLTLYLWQHRKTGGLPSIPRI
jgi:transposase InsO family protein